MQCHGRRRCSALAAAAALQASGQPPLNKAILPFLYQTWTIQTPLPRRHARLASSRRPDSIPFANDASLDSTPLPATNVASLDGRFGGRHPISATSDGPPARQHTITRNERKAFRMLFDSLTKRRGRSLKEDEDGPWLTEMELADIDPDVGSLDALTAVDLAAGESEDSQYPAELQRMASSARLRYARDAMIKRRSAREKHEQQGDYNPEQVAQKRLFRTIKRALKNALTDTDIWTVLQRELFPRLTKLEEWRLEQEQGISLPGTAKKRSSAKRPQTSKSKRGSVTREQSQQPPLASLSLAAYSSLFFLAARELSRRTSYTPLAPAVLAALRAHSLTASLVGTSVALYNETISHRWRTGRDVGSMLALLRDMTSMGMPMSQLTYDMLDEASQWAERAQIGEFGYALAAVEKMIGRQAEWRELREWRDRAREGLEQRALTESRRAEAYAQIKAEGALADDEPAAEPADEVDDVDDAAVEDDRPAAFAGVLLRRCQW